MHVIRVVVDWILIHSVLTLRKFRKIYAWQDNKSQNKSAVKINRTLGFIRDVNRELVVITDDFPARIDRNTPQTIPSPDGKYQ